MLRKQIECLSRLIELDETEITKLEGKTPNVGVLLKHGSGRLYGLLSEIAHFSTSDPASLLHISKEGERIGPSHRPHFKEIAVKYFKISHFLTCRFAMWLLQSQKRWYKSDNFDEADQILMTIVTQAFALELITIPKRCLTPRSSGAPTAGHQALSGGRRYIFTSPGLASCRRRPLSSNVRPRNPDTRCSLLTGKIR